MWMYFDDNDSIVELKNDPGTDYQDELKYVLLETKKRNKDWRNIEILGTKFPESDC